MVPVDIRQKEIEHTETLMFPIIATQLGKKLCASICLITLMSIRYLNPGFGRFYYES